MVQKLRIIVLVSWAVFLLPSILAAQQNFTAKVIEVFDGDTIMVLKESSQVRIRLHGIDAPEKGQSFGNKARKFTAHLVSGKTVLVNPTDTDRHGRTVAWVFVEGRNANEAIVRAGFAWHFEKYSSDANLAHAEAEARDKKAGLWRDPGAVSPWTYRQLHAASATPGKKEKAGSDYHGNVKSKVYHRPGCAYYNCKNCTAVFGSKSEAEAAGFRPCGRCRP